MSDTPKIFVLYPQVPEVIGGTEKLAMQLVNQLILAGYRADTVSLPFKWEPKEELVRETYAWRLFNLNCDMVIPLKFPAYYINHKLKVPWLQHQFRQIYDMFGSEYSGFSNNIADADLRRKIYEFDQFCLTECRHVYTNSRNTADRLLQYCGLEGEPLYPPTDLEEGLGASSYQPFIFAVGRLEDSKRFDLLLNAIALSQSKVTVKIVGKGTREQHLRQLTASLKIEDRVEFLGGVSDEELVELYNTCRAVHFSPRDEDFGLITVEAMKAGKPVITSIDSGGPTELVEHEYNGYILAPEATDHARILDELIVHRELAEKLGNNAKTTVENITWRNIVQQFTKWLPR